MSKIEESTVSITVVTQFELTVLKNRMKQLEWSIQTSADFLEMSEYHFRRLLTLQGIPKEFTETQKSNLEWLAQMPLQNLFPNYLIQMVSKGILNSQVVEFELNPESLKKSGVYNIPSPPDRIIELEELREALDFALASLPPREETVLRKVYFEGLLVKEVAKQYAITDNRVKSILSRGLTHLRHPSRLGKLKACF